MSLHEKKQGLFDSKTNSTVGRETSTTNINNSLPTTKSSTATMQPATKFAGALTVSSADKHAKITEARRLSEAGMNHLKTSVFQWKPDYLAAAPLFESSAEAYKYAGEYLLASTMMVKSAESHERYGSLASAALATNKAATFAKQANDVNLTVTLKKAAAEYWGVSGDLQRCGETLASAAKELESVDLNACKDLYLRAVEIVCPASTPPSQLAQTHPSAVEVFRSAFAFCVGAQYLRDALMLAGRMAELFRAFETESSRCKALLCVTLLQLALGDFVLAQQTFLQEHLSDSAYMASKECELADLLVLAFSGGDVELLERALAHPQINYLDKNMQQLARKLTVLSADFADPLVPTPEVGSPSAAAAAAAAGEVPPEVEAAEEDEGGVAVDGREEEVEEEGAIGSEEQGAEEQGAEEQGAEEQGAEEEEELDLS